MYDFGGFLVGGFAGGDSLRLVVSWGLRGVLGFWCFGFRGLVLGLGLSVICFRVPCGFRFEGCLCLVIGLLVDTSVVGFGFPGFGVVCLGMLGFGLAVFYTFLWVWCNILFASFGFLAWLSVLGLV